jgi:hypothetical protein
MTSAQHKKRVRVIAVCLGSALLYSCATAPVPDGSIDNSIRPNLPSETTFNKEAGNGGNLLNGDLLYLTLRLEDGENLLFLMDTGSDVSGRSKPASSGRMKTSHFEGSIALGAAVVAQGRGERTQRELTAFNINFGGQWLVPTAHCA